MRHLTSILLTSMLLLVSGCSVKEERGACPCRLFLDLSSVDFSVRSPVSLFVTDEDAVICGEILSPEEHTYEADVPRAELDIIAWSGARDYVTEQGFAIPLGYDCPPVYIHSSKVIASGEVVRDTVVLRKNHCVLTINFMETEELCALTLRGAVAGFDGRGNPRPGEFSVCRELDAISALPAKVILPRQIGDPLYLDVTEASGRVKTFPLHDYIAAAGYDWSEPDLKDLDLTLNYTLTSVSLVVLGWDEEFVFDVVI